MGSIDTCRLCSIFNTPAEKRAVQDTQLDQTEHFEWIPGLGAFVEGYSLIVSKSHVLNTGGFEIHVIKELEAFLKKVRSILTQIYNTIPITVEHGSMGDSKHAGSCIEHHHLHMFPANVLHVPKVLLNNFRNSTLIDSLQSLRSFDHNRVQYIYYSNNPEHHIVFEVSILPRQYIRQVLAAELNCPQDWDWRQYPFIENITSFVTKVQNLE
jgi:diadenosine tetraphosphate (Ap4A) HIT family hydrolase